MSAWKTDGIGSLQGRRMIVTGSNTGLGYQSALAFARSGADVVLAVRNVAKGEAAAARIRLDTPSALVRVGQVDLADLASVRSYGEAEAARGPVDALVNNAGVMLVPERKLTVDGFESHMGVNHLGHVLLTSLLLPAVAAAPAGRGGLAVVAHPLDGPPAGSRAEPDRPVLADGCLRAVEAGHAAVRPGT